MGGSPRPQGPGVVRGGPGCHRPNDPGLWGSAVVDGGGHPFPTGVRVLRGAYSLKGGGVIPSYDPGGWRFFPPHLGGLSALGYAWIPHRGGSSPWTWGVGSTGYPTVPGGGAAPSQ